VTAELYAALARLDSAGRTDFPDVYAGLEIDERRGMAIVYRVPSAAFDDHVRRTAGGLPVELRDAVHPLASLTALQERITADLRLWAGRGVRINTVGARHDGSGVEVGTEDVAAALRDLPGRYGADAPIIVVEQGPVVPLPAADAPGPRTARGPRRSPAHG